MSKEFKSVTAIEEGYIIVDDMRVKGDPSVSGG